MCQPTRLTHQTRDLIGLHNSHQNLDITFSFLISMLRAVFGGASEAKEQAVDEQEDASLASVSLTASQEEDAEELRLEQEEASRILAGAKLLFGNSDKV